MSIEPAEQPIPADESEPSRPPEGGPTDEDTHPLLDDPPGLGWVEDGMAGFERLTLGLDTDEQGQNLVTVVRPQATGPRDRTRRAILSVHGWSDYFYNAPLARAFEEAGYAFHAVDLRHYGRSLREGQTPGWTDDLARYDADLEAALATIAEDHPLPPVLMGHSTGGLIASLWAHRNPGRISALVLNSPWLEMQGSAGVRLLAQTIVDPVSALKPYAMLTLPRIDYYWRTLSDQAEGEWDLHPLWRPTHAFEVPAAWLSAVLKGHRTVARRLQVSAPILVLVSARGHRGTSYDEAMLASDIVLDPDAMARRSLRLGDRVTVHRLPDALHDVFASPASVREAAGAATLTWLGAYAPPSASEAESGAPDDGAG